MFLLSSCSQELVNYQKGNGLFWVLHGKLNDGTVINGYAIYDKRTEIVESCGLSSSGAICRSRTPADTLIKTKNAKIRCENGVTGNSRIDSYRETIFGRLPSVAWLTLESGEVGAVEYSDPEVWDGKMYCSKINLTLKNN